MYRYLQLQKWILRKLRHTEEGKFILFIKIIAMSFFFVENVGISFKSIEIEVNKIFVFFEGIKQKNILSKFIMEPA